MMMKLKLIPILLLFGLAATGLQAQTFETDFAIAQESSQAEGKRIMLVFSGSDWCKPCILLKKKILATTEFSEFSQDKLVVVNLDFPYQKKNRLSKEQTAHNEALAERYNPKGAFPLVLILNPDLTVSKQIAYSPNMEPEAFIQQISPNLTP